MIRLWLAIACTLLIVSPLCMAVFIGVGRFIPEHPMLAGLTECDTESCWLGIDLQDYTPAEARTVLRAAGYESNDPVNFVMPDAGTCDVVLGSGGVDGQSRISSIQLLNCEGLTLGDVWMVLGTTHLVANDCFNNWVLWYDDMIAVFISGRLLPMSPVTQIALYNRDEFGITPYGVDWHGFALQWRYNQLEGDIRGC